MKIGIITFTYGQNYGNKLQNYALLKVLKKEFGDEVYTLQNVDSTTRGGLWNTLKHNIEFIFNLKGERSRRCKQEKFDIFSNKYLNYYRIPLERAHTGELQDFDAFICGSDQIWNPYYNGDIDLFTASFAVKARRVSYAASFGLNAIPESKQDIYRKWIRGMDYIGVREEQGSRIVKDLTGRFAKVQVDPTMLMSSAEWEEFAAKPNRPLPEHYIVSYFIRGLNSTAESELKKLSNKTGLPVIYLNNLSAKEWFDLDPQEFVWMIKNSDYVIADSFHATVFAIIFHRPFHCFDRIKTEVDNEQSSRLSTLLGYFGLEKCASNNSVIDWNEISFQNTDTILYKLKQDSKRSLINSIKGNNAD